MKTLTKRKRRLLIAVISFLLFWLAFHIKRLKEENFMRQTFGAQYTEYSQTTGAIFLFRAVRLTAARLLTSMLEHLSAAPTQTQAPTMMAQSAGGILMAPHVAVMQLIGATA